MSDTDFRFLVSRDLDARLANWGRVMIGGRSKEWLSNTAIICHRMEVAKNGEGYESDIYASHPLTPEQISDAHLVERAWRTTLMPTKEKAALAAWYVYRLDPRFICRRTNVPYRRFNEFMFRACHMIDNILRMLAIKRQVADNSRQDKATTDANAL